MPVKALAAVICALAIAGCGSSSDGHDIQVFRVPSESMEPTYSIGDVLVVDTEAYRSARPTPGDVVVLHPPAGAEQPRCGIARQPADGHACARPAGGETADLEFLKRIAAVGGDKVSIRGNRTRVDGRQLDEPYVNASTPCGELCNLPKPITVPDGSYFVMGDNRGASADSRSWGPVPLAWIVGKVIDKQ
jgi:signal peptidase I